MRLTFDVRALLRLTAPLVLVVSVAGCGGDSSPTGPQTGNPPESGNPGGGGSSGGSCPGSVGSGTYRATVDGTTYNFTQIIASFSRKKGEFDPDVLMLQGGQCDGSLAVGVLIMDFSQRLVTGRALPDAQHHLEKRHSVRDPVASSSLVTSTSPPTSQASSTRPPSWSPSAGAEASRTRQGTTTAISFDGALVPDPFVAVRRR